MEKAIRNVADIDTADRRALEHVIGKHLAGYQQIIISVVNLDLPRPDKTTIQAPGVAPLGRTSTKG